MNAFEKELQKRIEAGEFTGNDDPETKAYEQVFKGLHREPDFRLKDSFADKVVSKAVSRREAKSFREYVWMAVGLVLLLAAFVVTIVMTGFKINFGFLRNLSEFKGVLLFGGAFIIFLHWLDKRLLGRRPWYHK
jgi:hypothetical protein